jgi:AraC family transcriptional regulator
VAAISILEAQASSDIVLERLAISGAMIELCAFPEVKAETVVVTERQSVLSLGLSRMHAWSEVRRLGDRRMSFARFGALGFRPAGVPMEIHVAGGAFHSIRCRFEPERLGALGRGGFSEAELAACFDIRLQSIEEAMLRLAEELAHLSTESRELADALVSVAVIDLRRHLDHVRHRAGHRRGGLPAYVLKRVVERIDQNGPTPSISDLAALAGVSRFHFMRCFAQATGSSPGAFIQAARIARAKALLASNELSLQEIARALHYANDSAFSTAFRRATGRPPGAYRETLH